MEKARDCSDVGKGARLPSSQARLVETVVLCEYSDELCYNLETCHYSLWAAQVDVESLEEQGCYIRSTFVDVHGGERDLNILRGAFPFGKWLPS
jgi:hypothetical protein